ncbi:unnamed protein product [Allacma fusca]|uniref:CRAL-TRIO domain-containing protein n=1 Tax=Allacma fusca TaxID=39272 RepID=A0A8J2NTJ2_9HEXA|nr:unnamed protein product [Allacma fusca]
MQSNLLKSVTPVLVLIFLDHALPQGKCGSGNHETSSGDSIHLKELYPYYVAGYDFDNLPVVVIEVGHWDYLFVSKNLDKYAGEMDDFRNNFHGCLRKMSQLNVTRESEEEENISGGFALLLDLNNFSLKHFMSSESAKLLLSFWKGFKQFDDSIAYAFYINMNAVAENFALLSKPLMSKAFGRSQLFGTKNTSWIPALQRKIPTSTLPSWYGGEQDCDQIELGYCL